MSLAHLHARLSDVHDAIQSFDVPLPRPPIISHEQDSRQVLPGLRFLREEVKRDCGVLDKLLRESVSSSAPSTNAPYLIAVWDELVHARQPVAIYRTFYPANGHDKARGKRATPRNRTALKSQTRPVKVDVVAENGARWVRVNTIKNARLVMEFREIDSYLTSDEDEGGLRPRLAQTESDNSVLRMGRELLAAARANPAPSFSAIPDSNAATPSPSTTVIPQVTIRLTRLDPSVKGDPRVEKTVERLCDMGIDVQLGERPNPHFTPIPKITTRPKLLEPTTNINLDLSALIALISDISHSPLPRTEQEAHARFEPPQSYLEWKKDRVKSHPRQSQGIHHPLYDVEDGEGGTWENPGQHSRALAAQAIQEMSKGFLEEIHERISAVVTQRSTGVTFWTTTDARHRCLQIVSKIGGERERQRAGALLHSMPCTRVPSVPAPGHISLNGVAVTDGMSQATPGMNVNDGEWRPSDAYWEHSRHWAGFLPVVPVYVYPSILPDEEAEDRRLGTTFFDALTQACAGILSREATPASRVLAASDPLPTTEEALAEIPPAAQTSLPKLTVHTVNSMLAGASRGHTTLTTNRSSVKAVLKEMRRVCGRGVEPGMGDVERAALWVVDPRSLSEGMRSE